MAVFVFMVQLYFLKKLFSFMAVFLFFRLFFLNHFELHHCSSSFVESRKDMAFQAEPVRHVILKLYLGQYQTH
jgi:hypothetical protein